MDITRNEAFFGNFLKAANTLTFPSNQISNMLYKNFNDNLNNFSGCYYMI